MKLRLALLRSACFAQDFHVDDANHRPFSKVHIEAQRSVSHGAERHAPYTRTRRQSGGGHFISKSLLLKIILRLALGITLAEIRANFVIKVVRNLRRVVQFENWTWRAHCEPKNGAAVPPLSLLFWTFLSRRSTHPKVFFFRDCFGNDALGAAERRRSKPKKKKKKKKETTTSFRRSTKKHTPPCGAGGLSTNARR